MMSKYVDHYIDMCIIRDIDNMFTDRTQPPVCDRWFRILGREPGGGWLTMRGAWSTIAINMPNPNIFNDFDTEYDEIGILPSQDEAKYIVHPEREYWTPRGDR